MSKYTDWIEPDKLTLLTAWARDGLRDDDIAKNIGISRTSLYEWKKKYPDIMNALKKGKEVIDIEVENSLLKSAMGYTYDEVTREPLFNPLTGEPIKDENGNQIISVTRIVTKYAAPSPVALFFWLKNRKPNEWRDKREVGHSGETDLTIKIDYGEDDG